LSTGFVALLLCFSVLQHTPQTVMKQKSSGHSNSLFVKIILPTITVLSVQNNHGQTMDYVLPVFCFWYIKG